MDWNHVGQQLAAVAVFGTVGVLLFLGAFWCATKVIPFSLRKEIEEDHNSAVAILVGSVMIGLAIIVASAIRG
ncbi:MAG: hypothetical protein HMLKMBBP_02289 [Planctomycetes bacterium]|nr:hypothetical protein [Planctomycetota bacterium]